MKKFLMSFAMSFVLLTGLMASAFVAHVEAALPVGFCPNAADPPLVQCGPNRCPANIPHCGLNVHGNDCTCS